MSYGYQPPGSSRAPAVPPKNKNDGSRSEPFYQGGRDFSRPSQPGSWSVLGDTRSIYSDGGSEISYDTLLTPPFGHTDEFPYAPQQSIIPQKDRTSPQKKLEYYFYRANLMTTQLPEAEISCTRAIDIVFSWPGYAIPEIWEQRYQVLYVFLMWKVVKKDWEAAREIETLARQDCSDPQGPGQALSATAEALSWYIDFCIVIGCELFKDGQLDEAESRCQTVLKMSSHPALESQNGKGVRSGGLGFLKTLEKLEGLSYCILALIMAKKGDMLEAGFYKSLVAADETCIAFIKQPPAQSSNMDTLNLGRFADLWDSIN
ncbi:hypothetical protein TWF481_003201 [Arthrobotrys musiformis]|uniref:Uncharacterized protein n=1 Tax=Arthrobotrys musiformis TaxID=47236 RepID=A0AAV9VPP9_9PEZI